VGRPTVHRHVTDNLRADSVRPLGVEQSNSSSIIDERAVLKVLRRVEPGIHPEVEVLRHLTELGFPHVPALLGTLEYRPSLAARGTAPGDGVSATTIATLIEYVQSEGDAWAMMRGEASRFYEWAAAAPPGTDVERAPADALDLGELPEDLPEPLAEALDRVELLGQRTADLHRALAHADSERFRPEPFTRLYQRSMYQALRSEARSVFSLLRSAVRSGSTGFDLSIDDVDDAERDVLRRYQEVTRHRLECDRIRIHGDLHLAQVLGRGGEVSFIDFEGEPARPLGERAIKRSALVDVAGMVRSFDYVAHQGVVDAVQRGIGSEDELRPWADTWASWTTAVYVAAYLRGVEGTRLVPVDPDDVRMLLDVLVVRKAVYEVRYELGSRPDWAWIPLRALLRQGGTGAEPGA
jgi:maltose alpha-D-glucosyltransferase / alpha-amylase